MIKYRFGWLVLFALLLVPALAHAQSIRRIPVANTDISWDATNSVVRIRLPQYTTAQRDVLASPAVRVGEVVWNTTVSEAQVYAGTWVNLYRAGGTDVAVADGGTGASTAAAALSNLGVGTEDSPAFTGLTLGGATSRYTITLADDQFIGHTSASGWKIGDTGVANSFGLFANGGNATPDIELTQQNALTLRSPLLAGVANEAYILDTRAVNLTGLVHTSWRHGGTEIASLSIAGVPTFSGLTASRLLSTNGTKGLASTSLSSWLAGTANQVTVMDDLDGSVTLSLPQSIATSSSPTFSALTITGVRPVTLIADAGAISSITLQGDAGGWAMSYGFKGSAGTALDGFGAVGIADALTNFYIGRYNQQRITVDGSTGVVGINKDSSIGGQLHVVAKDQTTPAGRFDSAATPSADILQVTDNGTSVFVQTAQRTNVKKFFNLDPAAPGLTIAAGVITVTETRHWIDTEAAAATDDLVTINGGQEGDILILQTGSGLRDVTLKDGIGNIFLNVDRTLNDTSDRILLLREASGWFEISYTDN